MQRWFQYSRRSKVAVFCLRRFHSQAATEVNFLRWMFLRSARGLCPNSTRAIYGRICCRLASSRPFHAEIVWSLYPSIFHNLYIINKNHIIHTDKSCAIFLFKWRGKLVLSELLLQFTFHSPSFVAIVQAFYPADFIMKYINTRKYKNKFPNNLSIRLTVSNFFIILLFITNIHFKIINYLNRTSWITYVKPTILYHLLYKTANIISLI